MELTAGEINLLLRDEHGTKDVDFPSLEDRLLSVEGFLVLDKLIFERNEVLPLNENCPLLLPPLSKEPLRLGWLELAAVADEDCVFAGFFRAVKNASDFFRALESLISFVSKVSPNRLELD